MSQGVQEKDHFREEVLVVRVSVFAMHAESTRSLFSSFGSQNLSRASFTSCQLFSEVQPLFPSLQVYLSLCWKDEAKLDLKTTSSHKDTSPCIGESF